MTETPTQHRGIEFFVGWLTLVATAAGSATGWLTWRSFGEDDPSSIVLGVVFGLVAATPAIAVAVIVGLLASIDERLSTWGPGEDESDQ